MGELGGRKEILRNQESRQRACDLSPAVGISKSAATLKYDVARSAHRPSSLAHTMNPLELLKLQTQTLLLRTNLFLNRESVCGKPPLARSGGISIM
jgi:hypothetical protein